MPVRIDAAYCQELVSHIVRGQTSERQRLVEYLWPHWLDLLRASRSMGSFAKSDDHVRNVATRLMAKLSAQGRGLESYEQWRVDHPQRGFDDWMRVVTTNAARDYLREQLGPRQPLAREPSPKRLLNEFTLAPVHEDIGVRPAMTQEQTARELIEFASTRLSPEQARALALWLEGGSFEEIGVEIGLPAEQCRRVLRSAVAILRRHFADSETQIDDSLA